MKQHRCVFECPSLKCPVTSHVQVVQDCPEIVILRAWYGISRVVQAPLGNNLIQLVSAVRFAQFHSALLCLPEHPFLKNPAFLDFRSSGDTSMPLLDCWSSSDQDNQQGRCRRVIIDDFFGAVSGAGLSNWSNIDARRILTSFVLPWVDREEVAHVGDDTLVMHVRSGDAFTKRHDGGNSDRNGWYYQPPACFYRSAVLESDAFDIILVTEPDQSNPVIKVLQRWLVEVGRNVTIQTESLRFDVSTMLAARHFAIGVGTFGWMLSLLSDNIERLYTMEWHDPVAWDAPYSIMEYRYPNYKKWWSSSEERAYNMLTHHCLDEELRVHGGQ